jgi:WD40 repeat protein
MSVVGERVRSPYKGLSPFDDSDVDALLFFGRSRETEIVVANALAARLTVLYGPSGVGKSSLLRAGVVHRLRRLPLEQPLAVAYFNTWSGDPVAGLETVIRAALADTFGGDPGDAPGSLPDRIESWTAALRGELCLVLDQLEELFLYHGDGRSESGLLEELPELVTRPGLRVNVILGIRDDELARLDVFKARIPALFSNYLRLDRLDREAGRAAILGPLGHYNELAEEDERVSIEPTLVDAVLDEVEAGRIDSGVVGRGAVPEQVEQAGRIEAPYLQLVLQRLWDVERSRDSALLRVSTLSELGGAQHIVEDHLDRAMAALTEAERNVAAGMFDHLVTPSGTKIAHTVRDLASFARVDRARVEPVLRALSRERILRPTGDAGGDRYEIYHDVLAGAVLAWQAQHESESMLARERVEAQQRQRRLAIIAAISLAAFAVMAVLAVYAVSQRSSARHQTAIAQQRRVEAEQSAQKERVANDKAQRALARLRKEKAHVQALNASNKRLAKHERDQAKSLADQNLKLLASKAALERTDAQLNDRNDALDRSNATLNQVNGKLQATNVDLLAAKARAVEQRKKAEAATGRARMAKQKTQAGLLLERAQAELATDPAASVQDVLDSDRTARSPRVESTLRTALLALHVQAELPGSGPAAAAAYSPDGSLVAIADRNGIVRLFRVASASRVAQLENRSPLNAVAFSPDGRTVAAAAKDGRVRVWDAETHALRQTLVQGAPAVTVAYSADGRLLATGGGNSATLWDAASGLELRRLPHARPLRSVAFSPDSSLVLTVSNESAAHVWNAATGEPVAALPQRQEVTSAAFSPDGSLVVTGSRDTTGAIWEARTGREVAPLVGHTSQILAVAFSPVGDRIATGSADGSTRVWGLDGRMLDSERGSSYAVDAVAFAPDGQSIVSASTDGTAFTFGPAQQTQRLLGQAGGLRSAAFAPDGSTVMTLGAATVRLWEPYGEPVLRGIHRGTGAATSVAFDPSGRLLASGGEDGDVVVQHAHGVPVRTLRMGSPVVSLSWGRDNVLAIATRDGKVHLRPGARARDARTLAHGSTLVAATMRVDGGTVATAGTDGAVRIWLRSTGALLYELTPPPGVTSVALDPTGALAAVGDGKVILVYDLRHGGVHSLVGHTDRVTAVAFSPDGSRLASVSRDRDGRVWNASTFAPIAVLRKHSAFVSGVAFSPDGRWIATAGPLKAGIWSASPTDLPGSFLAFARGNTQPLASVAFSSRGWELATAARDGSIRVVDCKLCATRLPLEAYARAQLARLHR